MARCCGRCPGRIEELGVTHEGIEHVAGLAPRYLTKVCGSAPIKKLSVFTALCIIQTLGLTLILNEDPELTEKMKQRLSARRISRTPALARTQRTIELTPDFLKYRARRGGQARAKLPNLQR